MQRRNSVTLVLVAVLGCAPALTADRIAFTPRTPPAKAILWNNPGDLRTKNLLYGIGGKGHQPAPGSVKFLKEDLGGTSPKFSVLDANGVEWKAKIGIEAQPETVATRLVWAAGYFTDEDYLVPDLRVEGLPAHLERGNKLRLPGDHFRVVRLERNIKHQEDGGDWSWKENPFLHTKEFNALRTLMALINNWDVKDVNNRIYLPKDLPGKEIYGLADLGGTFGTAGIIATRSHSRGYLPSYEESKFISSTTDEYVNFAAPARPTLLILPALPEFIRRVHMQWIGDKIPREDARWLGALLGRLSDGQIKDAFRAAGYDAQTTESYARVIRIRITELNAL